MPPNRYANQIDNHIRQTYRFNVFPVKVKLLFRYYHYYLILLFILFWLPVLLFFFQFYYQTNGWSTVGKVQNREE